jgi:hypothetical protein
MLELLKNNRQALIEELTDKGNNDTASTTKASHNHQNKQKQNHDPITSHAHTVDIARAEATDTPSRIEKDP